MKFAVIGGDERQLCLVRLLREDGHRVYDLALGSGGDITQPLINADAVILPLPAFKEGYLNAPLCDERYTKEYILSLLKPNTHVFGGMTDETGIDDYYKREELVIKNALITSECTVALLQTRLKAPVCGKKFLVAGYGRIGKLLSRQLYNMGADVTASARKASDLASIRCAGLKAIGTYDIADSAEAYDVIINTVPHPVIDRSVIDRTKPSCVLTEIASPPYGIDMEYARSAGRDVIFAPGLPGRMMPLGAAEAIKETIYEMLEEKHEQN